MNHWRDCMTSKTHFTLPETGRQTSEQYTAGGPEISFSVKMYGLVVQIPISLLLSTQRFDNLGLQTSHVVPQIRRYLAPCFPSFCERSLTLALLQFQPCWHPCRRLPSQIGETHGYQMNSGPMRIYYSINYSPFCLRFFSRHRSSILSLWRQRHNTDIAVRQGLLMVCCCMIMKIL